MIATLFLAWLLSVPAPVAPAVHWDHAGYLLDVRAQVDARDHLLLDARLAWPVTPTRKALVVEGLDASGTILFTREVSLETKRVSTRHKRAVEARLDLELPALAGVSELRVRAAH